MRKSHHNSLSTETRKKRVNKHVFVDQYIYTGTYTIPTSIQLVTYDKTNMDCSEIATDAESFSSFIQKGRINWFNIVGLTNYEAINKMLEEFGFDSIDGKDVLTPQHVVKVDDYADHVIIVMGSCFIDENKKIGSEHICFLAKENLILSFSEKYNSLFQYMRESLDKNIMDIRCKKSGMLLAFLLNVVLGQLIETALYIENELEFLEKRLLDTSTDKPDVSRKKIQRARHANLIIRRNTTPLKKEFDKLLKDQVGIIDESMIRVFTELGDQLEYIIQTSENSKDILSSIEDLYISHSDVKMNSIMKRLTVVSTLFIPITFLVGVWGMNFNFMPETSWKLGYLISWIILIGTALATWLYMKRKKWF